MSNVEPELPTESTTTPPSDTTSTVATVELTAEQAQAEEQKNRIKIGSQRDGAAIPKIAPRVVTEFKTGNTPTKQVFVQLDQQGNFQPLATPAPVAQKPAPLQVLPKTPPRSERPNQQNRPGQNQGQQQGQNRPPRDQQQRDQQSRNQQARPADANDNVEAAEASTGSAPSYRAKPAPLTPNQNQPAKPAGLFTEQRQGPRTAVPTIRGDLPEDLEAELAAALGETSLNELIETNSAPNAGTQLEPDTKAQARILRVTREFVFVELPGMNQGAMQSVQFEDAAPEPGAVIEVLVNRYSPEEGLYEVSLNTAAVNVADWSQVSEGMIVEAKITGHNKGGLECEVNKLRGFIPAGQVSMYRIEDFSQFVGEKFNCVVTEANPGRRNLVLSRRALLEREQAAAKEKLLAELEVGQEREAIVRSLRDFGAFCDLGGVDGLIHISQMSWERIRHPKELLEEGQKVKVKVQRIDAETGKISLSLRDFFANPWDSVNMKYPVSSTVKGTVSRVMEFGAFVKLEAGIEGLVHVSELSHKRVWRPSDVLAEGQEVEAKVLSIDTEQQRMSLSIKALESKPVTATKEGEAPTVEEEAPVAPKPVVQRKEPLKGGLGKQTGGAQFGLKW